MTWTSTHLAISSLSLYYFSNKKFREELRSNPRLFFLLSLGALAPDIDLVLSKIILKLPDIIVFQGLKNFFTESHRVWSHTFFLPLVIILIAPYIAYILRRGDYLTRNIRIFMVMWITHIIFDLTFGPLALFYPLDDRFYDVFLGMRVGLEGNSLLPVTIKGFYIDVFFKGKEVGSNTFFVNWTPEQRISYFGGPSLKLNMTNFFLHVALFVFYLLRVVGPFLKYEKNNFKSMYNAKKYTSKILTKFINFTYQLIIYIEQVINKLIHLFIRLKSFRKSWTIPITLLFLLLVSYIGGPYYGTVWQDTKNENDLQYILSDGIKLFSVKTYQPIENSVLDITVVYGEGAIDMKIFTMTTSQAYSMDFSNEVQKLTTLYDHNNITFSEFISLYQDLVNKLIPIDNVQRVNSTIRGEWRYQTESTIVILSGLYEWNPTNYFLKGASYQLVSTISRQSEYDRGIIWIWIWSMLLLVNILFPRIQQSKFSKNY